VNGQRHQRHRHPVGDFSLCLDSTGKATADGTLLELATCSGSTSRSWKLTS
jgi:hypothetical protein